MIYGAFERMVAFRYLRARRQEGFISVIAIFSLVGIALGVATLIITMSVMNGFRAELLGRILGFNGHIGIYGAQGGPLPDFDKVATQVKGLTGVVTATPIVEGQVLATARNNSAGVMVRGIRRDDIPLQPMLAKNILSTALRDFGEDNVLLGDQLARRLGLRTGDEITLLSPNGNATAFGTVPRIKNYKVAGTFSMGMFEYDSNYILMPLESAQTYFRVLNAATSLEVFVDNPDRAESIGYQIGQRVQQVTILDWQKRNASYFNAIIVQRNVLFLILTLMITVAAFNIISSMIMLVKDKGRDIAILRTMGATRGMIMRIFILSGASIGIVGTIVGFILGVSFAANIEKIRTVVQWIIGTDVFSAEIYFLTQIPARVETDDVVTIVVMAFTLSFLATLYPSWRAARLDPVEALRYE